MQGAAGAPKAQITHEGPVLSYLSFYYRHRAEWKFQKNRETNLFKHVLALEHVPTAYNAALLSYLQGLKSEGAKMRLRQAAEDVIRAEMDQAQTSSEGDTENAEEDADKPSSSYDKAVAAFRARLLEGKENLDKTESPEPLEGDLLKQLEKRQRAELMVFAFDGKLYEKPKPKLKQAQDTAQPGKKKKKNRTVIVEISSSSESDSSSSDSDSDDDKPTKTKSKATAKSKGKSRQAPSSSESSSDSDSDSSSSSDSS